MKRRIAIATSCAAALGGVAFVWLSHRPAVPPIERPTANSFAPRTIARGEVLAAEAHCASCHTRPGGEPYAGGYGVNTPFGIVYGPNITPDPATGIGRWSLAAFTRAMREGVSRGGGHLFPAFPYPAYSRLRDEDISALYAYIMTRNAVTARRPQNTVPFPLNVRSLQEGWKILFFSDRPYRDDSSKGAQWNRGRYLAEALGDCTGCHTPRNAFGAEKWRDVYAGTVVDGWIAPALGETNPSPVPWTESELFDYLRTGVAVRHGAATAALMTPVIRGGLALPLVPDSDVRAIAVYFSEVAHAGERGSNVDSIVRTSVRASPASGDVDDADALLYQTTCLSCHYNSGTRLLPARPELALNSALALDDPTNFIQPVLRGIGSTDGAPGLVMPAYASSLSDAEVARLAAYLRRTRAARPPWTDLEKKVSAIRRTLSPP